MSKEVRAKTFKSGNSVALRLPKALGIKEGVEMKVREEQGRYVVEPVEAPRRKIDLTGIAGWCTNAACRLRRNREIGRRGPIDVTDAKYLLDANICIPFWTTPLAKRCGGSNSVKWVRRSPQRLSMPK